jgi:hypothetical protein
MIRSFLPDFYFSDMFAYKPIALGRTQNVNFGENTYTTYHAHESSRHVYIKIRAESQVDDVNSIRNGNQIPIRFK